MSDADFELPTLAIIGLGLIGGSIAKSLKGLPNVHKIIGCVENERDAEQARALQLADEITTQVQKAVQQADLVVVSVGIESIAKVCAQINDVLPENAFVTDVGSTKVSVINGVRQVFGQENMAKFVPGHPIAGTEFSGITAGQAGLFENRHVLLTPEPDTRAEATAAVTQLWQLMGAKVSQLAAVYHDEVLAATSHLPHLLSFSLVDMLAAKANSQEIFDYTAGGFADFTRIAASDPTLWTAIMSANHRAITQLLDQYIDQLSQLRSALLADDSATIYKHFSQASRRRRQLKQHLS